MKKDQFEIYKIPYLSSPPLIVYWKTQDVGKLGEKVFRFLIEKLNGKEIAEIRPLGFFSFGGVRFKDDIVQAPESKFWACEEDNLLIFRSDEPLFEHYQFLNRILDFAKSYYHVKEIYTINGAISYTLHTHPRRILAVFNQLEIKKRLFAYGLEEMSWEGPPAISSYLLWISKKRGISGVSLWPEIPFYLASVEDPQTIQQTLSFLKKRFNLNLNLNGFDSEIRTLNENIEKLRRENTEVDQYFHILEKGEKLEEEQQLKLVREVYKFIIFH